MEPVGLLPGEQHLGGRAGEHGQGGADRDRVAQTHRALGGGDADAVVALAPEQLRALGGVVAQGVEHGARRGQEPVLPGRAGQLGEAGSENEAALHVAGHEAVVLQGDREAVRGGPGQPRGGDELGERGGSCLEGSEHDGGLVEDADARCRGVHSMILPSRSLRRKSAA